MSDTKQGTVKWFNNAKGYGFLKAPGIEEDIFVHYSDICGEGFKKLSEGERVRFELERTEAGLKARSVVSQGEPAEA